MQAKALDKQLSTVDFTGQMEADECMYFVCSTCCVLVCAISG